MNPLYTQNEFNLAKSSQKLSLKCNFCQNTFLKQKKLIQLAVKNFINKNGISYSNSCIFCSNDCRAKSNCLKQEVNCKQCNSVFLKSNSEIKKYQNHFCSKSCSATYNNTHKTTGTRRSKLEIWIEEQLAILYPNLPVDFNKKDTINSELDIYIPSLKLAFELNGIYHYEPIHGQNKLDQIQNNDHRKFQACTEKEISLCIIDTSTMKNFKSIKAEKFLNIITEIINSKNVLFISSKGRV